MITIGYSTKKIDPEFRDYIEKSCGLRNVEVIPFENPGTHSLTEAYNIILEQASNDIVVLCHDDIRVKTKKWGQKIIDHFNNSDYGIIGVAGTYDYKETGRWWEERTAMVGTVNHKHPETNKEYESRYSASVGDEIIPVVSLDGVFMVVSKSKLKYNFDTSVKGFHFYDVDFTLGNHLQGVKVGCITNVRILHYSVGMTNQEWENNRIKFVEKWGSNLPCVHPETKIFYNKNIITLKKTPKVTIVILSKDANDLLFDCIDSFLEKSTYPNYEIIVGDTGSSLDVIEQFKKNYTQNNIKLIEIGNYHFAKNNNDIVKNYVSKDTELILFSNNDISLINDVISEMVNYYNLNKNKVGTIGARLHYKNNEIQHSGLIPFLHQNVVHVEHYGKLTRYFYYDKNQDVYGNTAALLMINKNLFLNTLFDESFNECFEDVNLSVVLGNKNKTNVIIGNAVAYHYESTTRKKDKNYDINHISDSIKIRSIMLKSKNLSKYLLNGRI